MSNADNELFGIIYGITDNPDWAVSELHDAILSAGYRKTDPKWADTLINDGTYEYTISSDCDGSNVRHWRRIPGKTYEGHASPWEAYEPAAKP